ncbi:hypothetical protein DUI87_16902 [Hirundo rustica rustica]|uniref:Uncharacterized protein n=1 Tax=Hirundo rustica rustica TaxID=333673 RepID=A0A3M0K2Q6_HIRRU|nr:hypothetical protein DUI87_16902 [Hirundo rustica rustica]
MQEKGVQGWQVCVLQFRSVSVKCPLRRKAGRCFILHLCPCGVFVKPEEDEDWICSPSNALELSSHGARVDLRKLSDLQ